MTKTLTTSFEKNRLAEIYCRTHGLGYANHRGVGYNRRTGVLIISVDVTCSEEQWQALKDHVRAN